MNTNAEKWVKALRSGEYQQTREGLQDKTGFCCLGVACDLFMKDTGVGSWSAEPNEEGYYDFLYPVPEDYKDISDEDHWVDYTELPAIVREWLGVTTSGGVYTKINEDDDGCLAGDNDAGKSFKEIADIIASNPEGLFV